MGGKRTEKGTERDGGAEENETHLLEITRRLADRRRDWWRVRGVRGEDWEVLVSGVR